MLLIRGGRVRASWFWLGLGFESYHLHLPRMRIDLAELDLV
jgi:hypothetical protein